MDLDRYVPRASPLHRADARLKFLLAIAFILAIALLPMGALPAVGLAWLAIALLGVVARLGPLRTARHAVIALPFTLAALPLVFTRPGELLGTVALGPLVLTISGEGLRDYATIAVKSWVSVQAALLLAFTTPFHDLVEALRQLRLPRVMVAIISFMYRYLAVLVGEASRMNRAKAARSGRPAGAAGPGPGRRWQATVIGHMVGSLFLRSYERSERVYAAMQARGFDGELRSMAGPPLARRAVAWLAFGAALLAAFVVAAHAWIPRL